MSAKELQKKIEEQHKQILLYEKRLKDVVRAYKSLETEKNALQNVIGTLETNEETASANGETSDTEETTVARLKEALATLTKEKIKREAAFQSDKKALLAENEMLKERMQKTVAETEEQADKCEKIIKELSHKVKRIEGDRERELTDHGNVLAEMQKLYAKEKTASDNAQKQLVEVYRKLQDKDDLPNQLKSKEKELQDEISKLKASVEEWKNKAARTPTMQLLQDQMANMKIEHEKEIQDALNRGKQSTAADKQFSNRITELERTTMRLTERVADGEREKLEALDLLKKTQDENKEMKEIVANLESRVQRTECGDPVERLQAAYKEVLASNRFVNVYELLGDDTRLKTLQEKLERVEDDYERYKLKAEAVLKSKQSTTASATTSSEEGGLRSLIGQLHDKIRNLEVSHSADQAQYEMTTRNLRERISELERSEEINRNDMKKELQHKIAEMEHEMQKQRNRTLDVLAEKERELEVTKSILVSLRSEQLNTAPADPLPGMIGKPQLQKRKSGEQLRKYSDRRISSGSRRSVDAVSVCSAEYVGGTSDVHNLSFLNVNESRNIFYEDELAKRDKDGQDLRNALHHMDYRMREMEQSALCKDLQHHEMAEKLKEEIRILEGKLKLVSADSGGEMEYLRNIFVQYVNSSQTGASGSKNILKAIGMVLKLSPNEMKKIDKKAHEKRMDLTVEEDKALKDHLKSLGIEDWNPIIVERPKYTVYLVNGTYMVFDEEDAAKLRLEERMVAEPLMDKEEEDARGSAPYCLLEEQVSTLVQYGLITVVRKKESADDLYDESIFKPTTSSQESAPKMANREKAVQIVLGRKAKSRKRKLLDEGANSKALKVRKSDMLDIEVTEEEIEEELTKLNVVEEKEENDPRKELYEKIDYFSLPLPNTSDFRLRDLVFHDLWRRGYYLTTGLKFGCYYLAYEANPGTVHAKFLVDITSSDENVSPLKMITLTRLATQVKKTVLLAMVAPDSHIPHYVTIQWWRPY